MTSFRLYRVCNINANIGTKGSTIILIERQIYLKIRCFKIHSIFTLNNCSCRSRLCVGFLESVKQQQKDFSLIDKSSEILSELVERNDAESVCVCKWKTVKSEK